MKFDAETRKKVLERTDGQCHVCRKKLAWKNYGKKDAQGAWEIDHSNPQAKCGTHHLNNLYPACISCNRSKRDWPNRKARAKHGYRSAPYSKKVKQENTILGAVVGGLVGGIAGAARGARMGKNWGLPGMIAGAVLGGLFLVRQEPD